MKEIVIIIIFNILIIGCKSKNEITRQEIKKFSIRKVGLMEYQEIIQNAENSIDNMLSKNPSKLKYLTRYNRMKLDDIVCINKTNDKAILIEFNISLASPLDALVYYYGVKIKGKWFFFQGPAQIVAKYDEMTFEKLESIALDQIYKSYVFRNKNGDLEINDNFFSDFTSIAWKSKTGVRPWDKESWDQLYLDLIEENRLKIDTMDYSKLE